MKSLIQMHINSLLLTSTKIYMVYFASTSLLLQVYLSGMLAEKLFSFRKTNANEYLFI